MTDLLKKLMSEAYIAEPKPTQFLRSFFKSPDAFKFEGDTVEIDAVRGKEEFAIDVSKFSGGRSNKATKFTTKEYDPPSFDEFGYVTAAMLQKRLPGRTAYDLGTYTSTLADLLVSLQVTVSNKIDRAIELQCVDGLVNGKIILINGDEIDFKQKASHQIAGGAWANSSVNPLIPIAEGGDLMRKDGLRALTDIIMGETILQSFLNNTFVKELADIRQIERTAISMPIAREEGAAFHGEFSAGSYRVRLWSYPQFVQIPLGFGLSNEGDKVPYVPADKAILLPTEPEFRLYFAGIPVLTEMSPELRGVTGLNRMPGIEKGDMLPYFELDEKNRSILAGVRSRPLAIPVGIDEFAIITAT